MAVAFANNRRRWLGPGVRRDDLREDYAAVLFFKIISIALAKPSSSFDAVTCVAKLLTSSVALPIAIETPLFLNIARSFCMSPTVATASVEMPRRLAIHCTKVPLSQPGGVTSR